MYVSIGRWFSGSERSQQIYRQSYFRKVVLGFKINLQKLKSASLLYLLILLSWVVSTSFSLFLLSGQLFTTLFFWKRFSHRFRSGFRIPDQCGFRIPVHWILDSNIKNLLDSRLRILLHGAIRT